MHAICFQAPSVSGNSFMNKSLFVLCLLVVSLEIITQHHSLIYAQGLCVTDFSKSESLRCGGRPLDERAWA